MSAEAGPKYAGQLKVPIPLIGLWRSQYVILENSMLYIRSSANSTKNKSEIAIKHNTEVHPVDDASKFRFSVSTPGEPAHLFAAESYVDLTTWITTIRSSSFPIDTLSPSRFEVISVIGRGFCGKVMLVRDLVDNQLCAVKTIHKARMIKSKQVDSVITERNVLLSINNPFIVKLKFAFQTETKFYIGMEFAQGGELFRLMTTSGTIPVKDVRIYIAEIALALNYLHSNNILYRDLKPENILLSSSGHIKIADFGLAKTLGPHETTNAYCGTTEYMAPEIVQRSPYRYSVDWWALGVLMYEMLVGSTPFFSENRTTLIEQIINNDPEFPEEVEEEAADLISCLMRKDPKERYGFQDLVNHPFMKGIDFQAITDLKIKPNYIPDTDKSYVQANFDSEFTREAPLDSVANKPDGTNMNFEGFSYAGGMSHISSHTHTPSLSAKELDMINAM